MKNPLGTSWRTSITGWLAILWGAWLARVLWVHGQTIYFNLVYALGVPILFILVGIGLIHARDHKVSSEQAGAIKKDDEFRSL